MNRVYIHYPTTEGATFDLDYYTTKHMPMFAERLGDACTGWGADVPTDGSYAAIGWVLVTSTDALNATMAEHGAEIIGDVANYTTIAPQLIVTDVVV